ncbi:MAG: LysM peptidoglycan-binding domain-containing protein [Anaerolineae bacterium]|nr:LysM peptidoglycan-binding domain-containing protein [Anaerolineae bacterium]
MAVPKAEPAKVESKPATAPTPVQATAARIYEVKPGDSLSKIALEVYGNAGRWPEIFEANKDQIKNPNLIHPGQKLRIP